MASSPCISVERISIRRTPPAVVHSLIKLPNNPASLYLSVDLHNLIIYAAPASTVYIIDLVDLRNSLHQEHEIALAIKTLLETSTMIKVFFDARTPAKTLFDRCNIIFASQKCTEQSHIHEVQMMEVALRLEDTDREWLAGLDKCIAKDSNHNIDKLMPLGLGRDVKFDKRILHLPSLWKKYHDQLADRHVMFYQSFWVARIREATQKRLEVSYGKKHLGYDVDSARSGWDKEIIEEATDSWNEVVLMDTNTGGEWVGGEEHWSQFRKL